MKAFYDAVRALAYPNETQRQAGVAFSQGSFRVPVREALRNFERANRGIRHRLDSGHLSAGAGRQVLEPTERKARDTLSSTFTRVVDAVLKGHPHPAPEKLAPLLNAPETSGWLTRCAERWMLDLLLRAKGRPLHPDLSLSPSVQISGTRTVIGLTVYDSKTYLRAERLISIEKGVGCLADVSELERETRAVLGDRLKDVLEWPEFQSRNTLLHSAT